MCYSSLCVCVCVFFFGGGEGGQHFNQKGEDIAKYQLARYMHVFILFFKCEFFFFFLKFLMQLFQQHFNQKGEDIAKYQLARYMHVFIFFFTCEIFFFFLKFLMQLFQQQLYIYYYFSHLYTSITICQPRNSFSSLI